jgi:hypothetical protein
MLSTNLYTDRTPTRDPQTASFLGCEPQTSEDRVDSFLCIVWNELQCNTSGQRWNIGSSVSHFYQTGVLLRSILLQSLGVENFVGLCGFCRICIGKRWICWPDMYDFPFCSPIKIFSQKYQIDLDTDDHILKKNPLKNCISSDILLYRSRNDNQLTCSPIMKVLNGKHKGRKMDVFLIL